MGNISYQIGREIPREDIAETIQSNKVLLDAFERFQEHLLMNVVNVHETPRIMGPWVTIDPETEKFIGDFSDQANTHLSRNYREPFVVPENV
jgi:hypothetical protein